MKKEEKTKQTCEKIVHAATIEFGSRSYDAVSLNAICGKYQIAKGLIYHNFKNKDELYLYCVKKSFEKLMSYMEEGKEEAKTAREEIRIFLERREVFFAENPYDRNIFFNVMLYPAEHLKEALFGVMERYDAYIRKQYRHLLSKIRLREGISMEMAVEYLSLFQKMKFEELTELKEPERLLESAMPFQKLIMQYQCALLEVKTKFEVLNHELSINSDQNPILSIESRIKKPISILEKMKRKNIEISVQAIEENICDIAGIRVICCFPKDIYTLAEKICEQDDIRLIERKDYIKNPKPNGYRSLHLILEVPVFFMNEKKPMKVEVQMRTIAMDFWASIEHKLYYKKQTDGFPDSVSEDLGICAEQLHTIDMKMQEISERIYHQER